MNYLYPSGVSKLKINNDTIQVSEALTKELMNLGVDFCVLSKRKCGVNKVYAICRVYHPDGTETIEVNMRSFIVRTFSESYGYVMHKLKQPLGFMGYKSKRLFLAVVSDCHQNGFSAIPLDHPQEFPTLEPAQLLD